SRPSARAPLRGCSRARAPRPGDTSPRRPSSSAACAGCAQGRAARASRASPRRPAATPSRRPPRRVSRRASRPAAAGRPSPRRGDRAVLRAYVIESAQERLLALHLGLVAVHRVERGARLLARGTLDVAQVGRQVTELAVRARARALAVNETGEPLRIERTGAD